ncbi:MATE family efflux transporter [Litoribacillus peritrichatus]|uniref:Multidrug-efflux transporter n=1 Tax=Litoribacillus peritrichatus TaxID=718191 RepID=A0ABP7N511_9GAMM
MMSTVFSGDEAKSLVKLAAPIITAMTLSCLMSVIDTVMAGQVSAKDLAAVSIGSAVWNMLFLTMNGILMALTPQISKLNGQNNRSAIYGWYIKGSWFALVVMVCFLGAGQFGLNAINGLDTTLETRNLAQQYLTFILFGLPAAALFQAQRSLSEGNAKTQHALIVTIIGVLMNIPLNYLFIYGLTINDGQTVIEIIPELGGAGCGLASAIIFWLMLISMKLIQKSDPKIQQQMATKTPIATLKVFKHLSIVGIPIGLAIFAEVSVFTYIPLMIAHLGEDKVAAHQIALNVSSVMFMVPLGLSQAITVRTGYQLGRNKTELAQLSSRTGIVVAFIFGICSLSFILLNRDSIPALYTSETSVLEVASTLLVLAALFQLTDTLQITTAGALRGYQLTAVPMCITIISFWAISMPAGYLLGLESPLRTQLAAIISLPTPLGVAGF